MWRTAVSVLLLAVLARAGDLAASLEWEPEHIGWVVFRWCPLVPVAPDGVKAPADAADGRFGVLELADGVRVVVMDEAGAAGRGLWVDTDLDGDLAEETPAPWRPFQGVLRATDTVRIPLPGEAEPYPAMLLFQRGVDAHDSVGVITRVHRRGWIEVGNRLRPIALVDGNADLRFDSPEHDRLYLDLDGDGELRGGEGSYEMLRFGEAFAVGRAGYVAEVPDPLGSRVVLRALSKAPGPRRWLVPPGLPPVLKLQAAPEEPFVEFAKRFDERRDLSLASRYGTPEAFALLLGVAEQSASPGLRVDAVNRMGYAEYASFEADVARLALKDRDLAVRRAAVAALHTMDAPGRAKVYETILRDTKDDAEKDLVEDAARQLAYLATRQSRATLLSAFREQSNAMLKLQILQGGGSDPAGPDPDLVRAALDTDDDLMRSQALDKCWRLRDPKARAIAIDALADKGKIDLSLVTAAIRVLGRDPDKAAVRALLPWAQRGNNQVWREIYDELRLARDPEVTRTLADGLRDEGLRTRVLCADLLAGMRDSVVKPALLKAAGKEKDGDAAARMVRALAAQEDVPPDALLKLAGRADFPARGEVLALLARIGVGDPAVRRFFAAALVSRSAEERVLALDVAAATHDASFLPAVLACLSHEAWQVRLAAVEALRSFRTRDAVLPLIERLDGEESARVRAAIGETLFSLTGQDLLDAAGAWRAWWKDNSATFVVPESLPVRKAVEEGGTVARFYGLPVRTERLCFVLDRSESMEGVQGGGSAKRTRLEVAVEQLENAVKRLPDHARVNAVLFDSEIEVWRKSLAPLTDANRNSLSSFLASQGPKGKTNLYDALEAALLTEGVDTIFVLSDGDPTAGYYRETWAVLEAVRRLNQTRRIAIHAVAIGRDSLLLRRLAEESGGTYARR